MREQTLDGASREMPKRGRRKIYQSIIPVSVTHALSSPPFALSR